MPMLRESCESLRLELAKTFFCKVRVAEAHSCVLMVRAPHRRENLVRENVPEEGMGEQTWPTEEEIASAEAAANKKLPKGTSAYQAVWLDSDDEEKDEDGSDEDGDETMEADTIAGGTRGVEPSIAGDVRSLQHPESHCRAAS